jgi:hypothetical protein
MSKGAQAPAAAHLAAPPPRWEALLYVARFAKSCADFKRGAHGTRPCVCIPTIPSESSAPTQGALSQWIGWLGAPTRMVRASSSE